MLPSEFLFDKVLELVAHRIWKKESLPGLPVKSILKCRAVCSNWNIDVDNLIYKKFQYYGKQTQNFNESCIGSEFSHIVQNNRFGNSVSYTQAHWCPIHTFIQHFESTHPGNQLKGRNPLIWGANLSIDISRPNVQSAPNEFRDYQHHTENISLMLFKYGEYVHHLKLLISGLQLFENELRLRDWFLCLQNLKELKIYRNVHLDNEAEINLEAYSEGNFLPKLKSLETLRFDPFSGPVFNHIIRQKSHISTLTMTSWTLDYNFFTFNLPNLKKLKLGFCRNEIVEMLRSPKVQWPLESLKIKFLNNDLVSCIALLQVIEDKFANSLVNLDVETNFFGQTLVQNFQLNLPKLRQITITMYLNEQLCLDFLLPMVDNLENVSITVRYEFSECATRNVVETNGSTVQFLGFESDMLSSNIWTIFKMLKKFEVRTWICGHGKKTYVSSRDNSILKNKCVE